MTERRRRSQVVIAGGGVAALEALAGLQTQVGDRAELTLVAPEASFAYRPASTASPFTLSAQRELPLEDIARDLRARLVCDTVALVDDDRGRVLTHDGDVIPFDALLLAVGTRLAWPRGDGIHWGRGEEGAQAFAELLAEVEGGAPKRIGLIVPRHACWPVDAYELALVLAAAAPAPDAAQIHVVTAEERPLELFGGAASEAITVELEQARIELTTGSQDVETLLFDQVVSIPAPAGAHVEGVPHVGRGLVPVTPGSRVEGTERVWAAGDCTPLALKHALLAARQADVAVDQITAAIRGTDMPGLLPEPRLQGVIVFPGRSLSGSVWIRSGEPRTHCLWWPPGRTAGAHLARYLAGRDPAIHHGLVWHPHGLPVDVPVANLGRGGGAVAAPDEAMFEYDARDRELLALARLERESVRSERRLERELRELDRRQRAVVEQLEAAGYLHHDVTPG